MAKYKFTYKRYSISDNSLLETYTTDDLLEEPKEFDGLTYKLQRDLERFGLNFQYGNSLSFARNTKAKLLEWYYKDSTQTKVQLLIYKDEGLIFDLWLDFRTVKHTAEFIEIQSEKKDVFDFKAISDKKYILNTTEELQILESPLELINEAVINPLLSGSFSDAEEYTPAFDWIDVNFGETLSTTSFNATESIYFAEQAGGYRVRMKLQGTAREKLCRTDPNVYGEVQVFNVRIKKKNLESGIETIVYDFDFFSSYQNWRVTYSTSECFYIVFGQKQYYNGYIVDKDFSFEIDTLIQLGAWENLYITVTTEGGIHYNNLETQNSYLFLHQLAYSTVPIKFQAMSLTSLINQICTQSGFTYISQWLADYGLNWWLTTSESLAGNFTGGGFIELSFKQLFDNLRIWGLTYNLDGRVLKIERYENSFPISSPAKVLVNIKDWEASPLEQYQYNELNVGFNKNETSVFGKSFAGLQKNDYKEYSLDNNNKKKLALTTDWIADTYLINSFLKKREKGQKGEIVIIQTDTAKNVVYENEFLPTYLINTFYYNKDIKPLNIIINNIPLLRVAYSYLFGNASPDATKQILHFVSAKGYNRASLNTDLVMSVIGAGLGRLPLSKQIKFKTYLSQFEFEQIKLNPFQSFTFQSDEGTVIYNCNLLDISYNYDTQETDIKLCF